MIEARSTGCFHEALQMFSEHLGGEIWLVTGENHEGNCYVQNFFIPPYSSDDDLALNGSENGYFVDPLTVGEVRQRGKKIDPFEIKRV